MNSVEKTGSQCGWGDGEESCRQDMKSGWKAGASEREGGSRREMLRLWLRDAASGNPYYTPRLKCWQRNRQTLILLKESESEDAQSCPRLFVTPWTRFLHPWDFPGKNTGVGCHFLLQEIFPTQGLNPGLPHCRQMFYYRSHEGSHWQVG